MQYYLIDIRVAFTASEKAEVNLGSRPFQYLNVASGRLKTPNRNASKRRWMHLKNEHVKLIAEGLVSAPEKLDLIKRWIRFLIKTLYDVIAVWRSVFAGCFGRKNKANQDQGGGLRLRHESLKRTRHVFIGAYISSRKVTIFLTWPFPWQFENWRQLPVYCVVGKRR